MSQSHINRTQTQTSSSPLQVTVIVLRAHNLPRLKTLLGKKKRFYATVTEGVRTWKTRSVRSVGQRVEWNDNIDFVVEPRSRITISLYVKMTMRNDILVGRQEIACAPQHEIDIVFGGDDGHSTEATTLFLTITGSANRNSSLNPAVNMPSLTTADVDNAEGGVARLAVQCNNETLQSITAATSIPSILRTGDLPSESNTPPVQPVVGSQPETSRAALRRAEEAISNINTIKTWRSAVTNLKWVMDTVTPIAALNPYSKLAWSLLSKIPETLLQQVERDLNVEILLEAIRDAFEFVEEADTLRVVMPESRQATILEEMLECVSKCAEFIQSYAEDVHVGKRTVKYIVGQVDKKIEQYCGDLVRLRNSFLARATVTTGVAVLEAELNANIREMPYKGGWRFNDKRCLPGTREGFLDYIIEWVENPESERALVLLGQAGTGKSCIAHEIARRFDDKCLGSYFAFLRKEQSKDEAYQLFTTLARDLCDRSLAFKRALGRVIKDKSSLRGARDYHTLFECLLLEPLKKVPLPSPVLIVIDALDESGATIDNNGLHTFLAQRLIDLPRNFRILITSRPESGIEPAFANAGSVRTIYMDDTELATNTEQDIGMYLQKELPEEVYKDHGGKLAKAAEGLFQWAAVACGFINSPASLGLSKKECVQHLLGHSRERDDQGPLDNLYEEVLKEYFKSHKAQIVFRSVMGQLLAAIEPLSICSLIALRRHATKDDPEDPDRILRILSYLGSLLSNVTSSDQTRSVIPLHTSFRDFLTSKKSDVFYVDLGDAHHQLAHSCPTLMLDNLKFNICKLESSHLANCDVPDLGSRISKYIPPALSYACIHWGDHLGHVPFEHDLFKKLRSLLETKFLFWLEVLSIKNSVGIASPALSSLSTWLQPERSQMEAKNLLALVNDAFAFMRYFAMTMARSAPHIYISALPFAPTSSEILKQYIGQFPRTLALERGQLSHWPALEMTIQAHSKSVSSVAFSPDGQRIASASEDRTVRVWDATTGQIVAGPFIGHTDRVTSVAFSPDGQRIASASGDLTIRVWDATGQIVAGPFTGHTNLVRSVAFSPDGQRIASASFDHKIRVWDAATGQIVAGPFTGHTDWVTSVAHSPDGQRIASASEDRTVRVWDATTGQIVAGPFTGHTYSVTSVAFSPDGQRIASASRDGTIRVWDATTGQIVAGPFTGHTTDSVTSVTFSLDGQRIASASFDRMIRVWDSTTGQIVAGPFTGHTNCVTSVALSPDGQRIASASDDHTIRVWNATTGQIVAGRFNGHTDWITSVAFSLDGRIASASRDCTIRVWDATTGQVVAGPFTGHTHSITSVAFSPDGQHIASASFEYTIRVWGVTTGQMAARPFTGHTDWVTSVTFSPDGRHIASASQDRTIRVWDATTGQIVAGPFTGHADRVTFVAFSPDGQHIASASVDCTIRVWDATTGQIVAGPFTGHTDWVRSVAFSPDGQHIASASDDHTICVWDATTGQIVAGPFTGHTNCVTSVAFSSGGQHIASASDDHTIRVWNATTGQIVAGPFTGHTDCVTSVAFWPNRQRIASASRDRMICVWDVTAGQIVEGPLANPVTSIALSPDRQHTASDDRVEQVITEDIKIHFTDQLKIDDDGWMYGKKKELLLWIPELHRPCLHRPSTVWIAGQHETRLDFSKFAHGSNWATVYDPSLFQ